MVAAAAVKSVLSGRHAWSVLGTVSMAWIAGLVKVWLKAAASMEHTNRRGHFGIYCVFWWQQHLAVLGGTGCGPGIESSTSCRAHGSHEELKGAVRRITITRAHNSVASGPSWGLGEWPTWSPLGNSCWSARCGYIPGHQSSFRAVLCACSFGKVELQLTVGEKW